MSKFQFWRICQYAKLHFFANKQRVTLKFNVSLLSVRRTFRHKKGLRRLATETVCCVESEGINPR